MIAYLDSSILLRIVLEQPGALAEWPVPLDEHVLRTAAQPFPTIVRSLDAIHLSSAMTYRATQSSDERPLFFATHDQQLARAAHAMHFEVIGA